MTPEGLRLAVRLTPRASRNGIDGVRQGADGRSYLQLRVAAPPVEGAANAALVEFVAVSLDLRKSDVRMISGQSGRLKLLELTGDGGRIAQRLAGLIAMASRKQGAAE